MRMARFRSKIKIMHVLSIATLMLLSCRSILADSVIHNNGKRVSSTELVSSLVSLKDILAQKNISCSELNRLCDVYYSNAIDSQQLKVDLLAVKNFLIDNNLIDLFEAEFTKGGRPSLCLDSLSLEGDLVVHGVICCDNPSEGCFGSGGCIICPVGPIGPQGPPGNDGSQGPQGSEGPEGPEGPAGANGPVGPQGSEGPEGSEGPQGSEGPPGADGPQGPIGPIGPQGSEGPQGPPGADGADGPAGPLANDDFACTRSGEAVAIDVVANDAPGIFPPFPIDPSTVTIIKAPDHAAVPLDIGSEGVVTYVAATRFLGKDTFTYTVNDSGGNTSRNVATVEVDVRCDPPATANPRFIYSVGADIRQYSGTNDTFLTLASIGTVTFTADALATNRDDNLIYYAENEFIYAYDYIADMHFEVVDVSADARFTATTDLSNGGATYHNGVLYLAGNGDTTGYYRIAVDPYVPGSLAQTLSDVYFIEWSDGFIREMGDMQYDPLSGNIIVCSDISDIGGGVSIVTADSGVVLHIENYPNNIDFMQIARGPNNVFYINPDSPPPGNTIRTLNPATGQLNMEPVPPFTALTASASDMAEYICQPCS